jgi:glycosyltransferase involved in cell wall biosynthesis
VESHQKLGRSAAVIPCLNEARSIGAVISASLKQVGAVWVVDDGSFDATRAEAERAGATVIHHPTNLGKGASIRDGLFALQAAGFEFAVILDGDGQHDSADIPRLLEAANEGADLVIGNRMGASAEMPFLRRIVNRWMSAKLGQRLGMECPDTQCGFRVVRLTAWAGLTLRQNRFEVESEMLASFARAGLKVAFVPVKYLPAQRKSRIHPIADSIRWLRWWFATK